MTFGQFVLNLVLAVVAYVLAGWALGKLELEGKIVFVIAFLVGLAVFFANFAVRFVS